MQWDFYDLFAVVARVKERGTAQECTHEMKDEKSKTKYHQQQQQKCLFCVHLPSKKMCDMCLIFVKKAYGNPVKSGFQ